MKTRKLFWGLLLIGGGVLLALYALGVGVQNDLFRIISSIILLCISIVSIIRYHFLFFLAPLALIAYLWRQALGIPDANVWILLLAAAVLGIGLSVIFHKKWKKSEKFHFSHSSEHDWGKAGEVLNQDEQVDIDENLGEYSKFIHATNLKRVRIKCNMASMKVYFDQCQVSPEGLEILLKVNLSGVELHVPQNWKIDNQLSTSLGEVNGLNGSGQTGDVNVKLAGQVNLAEVKIVRI
jgi:predicted membrane protein